jgi:hypothetical protein
MRWCFSIKMEDAGRMHTRVLLPFDHSLVTIESLSSTRTNTAISLMVVAEAKVEQKQRIEALLWKIHGMVQLSVTEAREVP